MVNFLKRPQEKIDNLDFQYTKKNKIEREREREREINKIEREREISQIEREISKIIGIKIIEVSACLLLVQFSLLFYIIAFVL